jgi:fatty-acyl-CoA synthase
MVHGDWLGSWARTVPDKPALIDLATRGGEVITYLELSRRAVRAANLLRDLGVGPGDRVAVLGENRPEQVELYFAAAGLGAVLVPVNWRLTPDEVAYILRDSAPRAVFFGDDVLATVRALPGAGWGGERIGFDDRYPALVSASSPDPVATEGITDDTPVMLLYTSGTTGRPKGAVLTHGSVTWNAINTATSWDLHHADVTLTHTPFFHTGGWNVLTLPLLHRGGTVALARRFDAGETVEAIDRYGVTVLFAVPTMFQMMLDEPALARARLSTVRFFISGGAPCPIPLIEAFQRRGVVFKQGYGLTEVGPNCFVLNEKDAVRKAGSVGHPVLHLDTRVVTVEGQPVSPGEVGELQLRGPTVCAGYWRNPDASAAARTADGWFRTGDLFRIDDEGYHTVVGRLKEMFISGGENVYPAEVERVLYQLPGVVEAAVVGVPHEKWGEVGHAFVAFAAGDPVVRTEEVLDHCRRHLARYKVPKAVTVLGSLPKGSSGKIDKLALGRLARGEDTQS